MKKVILIIILIFIVVTGVSYISFKNINDMERQENIKTNEVIDLEAINIIKRGEFEIYGLEENVNEELEEKEMIFLKDQDLYYKIIENSEDYSRYKKVVKELPKDSEIDFDKNFIVIITSEKPRRDENEKDIGIYEISNDDTTTYIKLKQKKEPDYNNDCNNWYAIAKKSLLKEKIEVNIDY